MSTVVREARETDEAAPAPALGTWRPTGVRLELLLVAGLLLLAALVRLPTLDQPLVEAHAFRQTQTAYTALLFHEEGVDLLHPKLPVMGEPFEVPFELPLFQAAAAAVMSWGLSPDVAMRTTSLAFFLLSALLLWGLVRHVGGRAAAAAALLLYLFSPFAMLWSRTSLIEYMAVTGSLGWLWAGILWRERRRAVYAAAALAAGLVAMLVKPTTGAFWIVPLLAYTAATEGAGWRAWIRARRDIVLAAIVIVPFAAAMAWTRHADAIKGASEATAWLTSESLRDWNFGTLEQRLTWGNWTVVLDRIRTGLTGYPALLFPLAALVGIRTRSARFWAAVAAVLVLSIVTFWNLYVVHEYYLAAVSPVVAMVGGMGFSRLWQVVEAPQARVRLASLLVVFALAFLVLNPESTGLSFQTMPVNEQYPAVDETARFTTPSDRILFEGWDWAPVVPYYVRGSGHMFTFGPEPTVEELTREGYRILVTRRLEHIVAADFVRAREWTGVLGHSVYVAGDGREDLRGAPITATDTFETVGPNLLTEPVMVRCGPDRTGLPRGDGATVLHLAWDTMDTAKISVASTYGDVPARAYLLVSREVEGGPQITVGCRDAVSVTIVAVYSQPG